MGWTGLDILMLYTYLAARQMVVREIVVLSSGQPDGKRDRLNGMKRGARLDSHFAEALSFCSLAHGPIDAKMSNS